MKKKKEKDEEFWKAACNNLVRQFIEALPNGLTLTKQMTSDEFSRLIKQKPPTRKQARDMFKGESLVDMELKK